MLLARIATDVKELDFKVETGVETTTGLINLVADFDVVFDDNELDGDVNLKTLGYPSREV